MKSQTRFVLLSVLFFSISSAVSTTNSLTALRSFQLPFAPADVEFDSARQFLYATDFSGKKMLKVSLTSGIVAKEFQFSSNPHRIAITPNNARIYVTLITNGHDISTNAFGHIVEIDRATDSAIKQFRVDEQPFDIAATDNDLVIVTSKTPDYSRLRSYRPSTQRLLSSSPVREWARLTLHPSQQAVYAGMEGLSTSYVDLFRINALTGQFTYLSTAGIGVKVSGNVFAHPNGTNLVTLDGALHTSTSMLDPYPRNVRKLEGELMKCFAFDGPRKAFFAFRQRVGLPNLWHYHSDSFELAGSYVLTGDIRWAMASSNHLYAVAITTTGAEVRQYPNPARGGETNRSPVASFSWTPTNATVASSIRFDASSSFDHPNLTNELRYRWDFNDDGIWDTGFQTQPVLTNIYRLAGTKVVTLQVKDRFGASAECRKTLNLPWKAHGGATNWTFGLEFAATHAVLDPKTPHLYATDKPRKKLVKLNLITGYIDREFRFDRFPDRMTISPDGRWLYAILAKNQNGSSIDSGETDIAVFDLQNGANKTRQFQIEGDSYDLAVTTNGVLVTSGTAGWALLRSFNIATGQRLSTGPAILSNTRITLHTGQNAIYFSQGTLFGKVKIGPSGVLTDYITAPGAGGNVFIMPGGTNLLTTRGKIYSSSHIPAEDMKFVHALEKEALSDVYFDAGKKIFLTAKRGTASTPGLITCYRLDTFSEVASWTAPTNTDYLRVYGATLYTVSTETHSTVVQVQPNPATGLATNAVPVARFSWTPTNATTVSKIVFDGAASTDDQGTARLLYRWDWNDDGTFDTAFSAHPKATNRFNIAGSKRVTLQVKDPWGAINGITRTVPVANAEDPGIQGTVMQPYEIPFTAAHIAYDPAQPFLYATDPTGKRLVKINLTNGLMDRQFEFLHQPGPVAITPNGERMYVALRRRVGHTWTPEAYTGFIAEFDLIAGVKTKEFETIDPLCIAGTDEGIVFVSGGRVSEFGSYRASTGELLDLKPWQITGNGFAVGSDPPAIYFSGNHFLGKFTYDPVSGVLSRLGDVSLTWLQHLNLSPYGTNLITSSGKVVSTSSNTNEDRRVVHHLQNGSFRDVHFDETRRAMFTVSPAYTNFAYYNLDSLTLVQSNRFDGTITHIGGYGDWLYPIVDQSTNTLILKIQNPALGGETNSAPLAEFVWTGESPTTRDFITFDASSSSDDGGAEQLRYRWDWNTDGRFDTPFDASPTALRKFNVGGTHVITVEVKDRYGAISRRTKMFEVIVEADPGTTGETNLPFELIFPAKDFAFDSVRAKGYAIDEAGKKLVKLNLTNGLIERTFSFDHQPQAICISPNGQTMYVGLGGNLISSQEGYEAGYLAVFDLASSTKLREVSINTDPLDLVATDSRTVVVSARSWHWTELRSFSGDSGQELGAFGNSRYRYLSLHPSQARCYLSSGYDTASRARIGLNGAGALSYERSYGSEGDFQYDRLFTHCNGTNLISAAGSIYCLDDDPLQDFHRTGLLANGPVADVAFDQINGVFFTVGWRGQHRFSMYNSTTFQLLYSFPASEGARYVGCTSDDVFYVSVRSTNSIIEKFPNPGIGAQTNTAPIAAFSWSPTNPATFSDIVFDSGRSSDNFDSSEQLFYRWDWNSDGVFDTAFSHETNVVHRLNMFGQNRVTLEVKDRLGFTNRITRTVMVAAVVDPGVAPTGLNAAFRIPFIPIMTAFDPVRPYLYATDSFGHRLVKIDLCTGLAERVFNFDSHPDSISISPKGTRMYVAAREEPLGFYGQSKSIIAEFDLAAGCRVQELNVTGQPWWPAASDNGFFGVTSLLQGGLRFRVYSRTNAAIRGDVLVTTGSGGGRIAIDPMQDAFYLPGQKILINRSTGSITSQGTTPLGYNIFAHPQGTHMLMAYGDVYTKVNGAEMFQKRLAGGEFAGACFDTNRGALFTVKDYTLHYYQSDDFTLFSTVTFTNQVFNVGAYGTNVFVVATESTNARILKIKSPALVVDQNTPPVPAFTWEPGLATTACPVKFDAGASTDGAAPKWQLTYRWDFNGDGRFDTAYSGSPLSSNLFSVAGIYRVQLQVRDRFGAVSSLFKSISVTSSRPVKETDVLWRHSDGRVAIWHMDGPARTNVSALAPGQAINTNWQVIGIADVNRDGANDVIWKSTNNILNVWYLSGTLLVKVAPLDLQTFSSRIVAAADFNQDSHVDFLTRNTNGAVSVWTMNHTNAVSSSVLSVIAPDWELGGVGHLNSDRFPDLVWRHRDGRVSIWFTYQRSVFLKKDVAGPQMQQGSQLLGVADFNKDGIDDLLWREQSGKTGAWLMYWENYLGYLALPHLEQVWTGWQLLKTP